MNPALVSLTPALIALAGVVAAAIVAAQAARRGQPVRVKATRSSRDRRR